MRRLLVVFLLAELRSVSSFLKLPGVSFAGEVFSSSRNLQG
jgi:hypothetical protein